MLAAIGMLLVGIGLLVAATARTLLEVYVGYGVLIGLGTGFAYVPALAAVQRWFTKHRGLASGVAVSGIGVGTAIVPLATEALSVVGNWRMAFVVLGVLATLVGLAGALLLPPSHALHLAAALAHIGQITEARVLVDEVRKRKPELTAAFVRTQEVQSRHAIYLAQRERFLDGLVLAGLPE